jgi:hypothetical protein
VESVRLQLQQVQRLSTDAEVVRAIRAVDAKLLEVEMKLVDLRQTGQGQDGVRFGSMLISKMGYLANGMSSSDFTPTTQHVEVDGILREQLKQHLAAIDGVLASELAPLNAQLDAKGLPKEELADAKQEFGARQQRYREALRGEDAKAQAALLEEQERKHKAASKGGGAGAASKGGARLGLFREIKHPKE